MSQRVVVVGGGFAGVAVARAVERQLPSAEVVVYDPRPAFFFHLASLRASVRPDWAERLWIPYDGVLRRGRVERARVTAVRDGLVELADGRAVEADAVVVAVGVPQAEVAAPVLDDLDATRAALAGRAAEFGAARSAVVLGAGPVGLEMAGELACAHPGLQVTVIDPVPTLLPGPLRDRLRDRVRHGLDRLGVRLILGDSVESDQLPVLASTSDASTSTGSGFTPGGRLRTRGGREVDGQIWIRAFATGRPSPLVDPSMLDPTGRLIVGDTLLVDGHRRTFAVGDITSLPEPKLVVTAQRHVGVVTVNVAEVLAGRAPSRRWSPMPHPVMIIPLGDREGAAQLPLPGGPVFGAGLTRLIKGKTLLLPRYQRMLTTG